MQNSGASIIIKPTVADEGCVAVPDAEVELLFRELAILRNTIALLILPL